MRHFIKLILILLLTAPLFISCNDDKTEPYNLLVVGNGGDFTGYYILLYNGESKIKGFNGDQGEGDEASLYQYEKEIDEIDKIDVYVTRLVSTTSLSVKIYKYDKEVAEEYLAGDSTGSTSSVTMTLPLSYDGSSGDDDDDDTDTTTR